MVQRETSMNKRLRPRVNGGEFRTVYSLAECSKATCSPYLSLGFFLCKKGVKTRCSTLRWLFLETKDHRDKGML